MAERPNQKRSAYIVGRLTKKCSRAEKIWCRSKQTIYWFHFSFQISRRVLIIDVAGYESASSESDTDRISEFVQIRTKSWPSLDRFGQIVYY